MDRQIEGLLDRRIEGVLDRQIEGVLDRQIEGLLDRQIEGLLDRPIIYIYKFGGFKFFSDVEFGFFFWFLDETDAEFIDIWKCDNK